MFYKPDMERALALYEQLSVRNPKNEVYLRDIALVSRSLANAADQRHEFERMRKLVDRAVEIDRERVRARSLDRPARLELSFDLSMLASWQEATGDRPGATLTFGEVLAIREELVRQDDRDEQAKDRLLYVLCALGKLHGELHEDAASARYYGRAVALGAELSRMNSRPNAQFAGLLKEAKEALARASGQK
jgi:tetratricopeptide (TPR) repeat protein